MTYGLGMARSRDPPRLKADLKLKSPGTGREGRKEGSVRFFLDLILAKSASIHES